MSWRVVAAIVRRDLSVLAGSKPVVIPLVIVPLLLFAGLPLLVGLLPGAVNVPGGGGDLSALLSLLPAGVVADLPSDPDARVSVVLLVYLLAPMFLIVPLFFATVLAADSIAGERERKTLEALLLSPVADRELFVAKAAVAWIPAVAVTAVGAVIYGLIANFTVAGSVERLPFPNLLWVLLVTWLSPALAAVALGTVVLISARVRSFQEALQLGGLLVLPVLGLVAGQAAGALVLGPGLVAAAGGILWILAALLLPISARALRRTQMAERL